jgi:CheY-like chemotaxis protein
MVHLPILIGEDSEDDVFLLRRAFARAGISNPLEFVPDGEHVLAYLKGEGIYADRKSHPFPALLLLDIKMPRLSGLETLKAIRQDPELKRLIVIFLTASNQTRDINLAFDLRANSYLVKPATTEKFAEALTYLKDYWFILNQYPSCPVAQTAA